MKTNSFFKWVLTLCLTCMINVLSAQNIKDEVVNKQLPVLKTNGNELHIIADGKQQPGAWLIDPSVHPDIFNTSAKKVTFRSNIDSITFDIHKMGVYDFVVVTNNGDSALTRIQWQSKNPLEEPSPNILKRSMNGQLSKAQAQFDIDALFYTLSEVHPNLFSVCKQDELFAAIDQVKKHLPDSVNSVRLFQMVAPLVTKIGDGHTMLRFPYNDLFTSTYRRLPLFVKAMPDYTLRVRTCIDNTIPQDAEVISINQLSSKKMIETMMDYASGERDFFRIERINYDFPALFEMLYAADRYEVAYRLKGSKSTLKTTLLPATWEELKSRVPKKEQERPSSDYSFKVLENENIAIMDFRSFNDPNRMKVFADSMFRSLHEKGIKNLIIDLRNNGGGDSQVGDVLFRYISHQPFQQMGKSLERITPTTQRLMNNNQIAPGWYFYDSKKENHLIAPLSVEEGHYRGKVYLLISHHTFSSAGSFAWAFKQFGMGTVIGEESGGMNVCFGDILSYKLPVSGLLCTISFKRFWQYGADEKDIHGTLPDYAVPQDQAMDQALKLIRKIKKSY